MRPLRAPAPPVPEAGRQPHRREGTQLIAFAKFYEEFAGNGKAPGHTARDGTRLLPDDDATAEICRAYDLTPAAYKAARDKLGLSDTVIFHWFHPWAFRYELGELPPAERLGHAREWLKRVGAAYRWARADRLAGKPRGPRPAALEPGEAARPGRERRTRKK